MKFSSVTPQPHYNHLTVFVAICVMCSSSQSMAQDFEKTLMEQRVMLNGEQVTIIARHIYYESVRMITNAAIELSYPASLVEVDVVHKNGNRVPILRIATTAPYEVHREYRLKFPTIPILDVAVWRRQADDVLLICYTGGSVFYPNSAAIRVYLIEPGSALKPIPDPPVLKQSKHAGPWVPMSLDEIVGAGHPFDKSLLVKVEPPLEMIRAVAKKRQSARSTIDVLREDAIREPQGVVRIIPQGQTIKVLSNGVASVYDTKSKAITYRFVTESEEQLVIDAPAKYVSIPPEDMKRIWREMSSPHAHEKP